MPMSNKGLTKLVEECCELGQISSKKIAYMETDVHPDGKGSMELRLEDEVADVLAAIAFVIGKFGLNKQRIDQRATEKYETFTRWDKDENS